MAEGEGRLDRVEGRHDDVVDAEHVAVAVGCLWVRQATGFCSGGTDSYGISFGRYGQLGSRCDKLRDFVREVRSGGREVRKGGLSSQISDGQGARARGDAYEQADFRGESW